MNEPGAVRLAAFYAVCDAIALFLQPQAEAVPHDLASKTFACSANPLSQQETGERQILHEINFWPEVQPIGPYEKGNFDGRSLKSTSVVLRSPEARAVGILHINLTWPIFRPPSTR